MLSATFRIRQKRTASSLPTAHAETAGDFNTAIRQFDGRARLYEALDRTLRDRTRFFAAAAWTNRVLHRLASNASFCGCSPNTIGLLATLGHSLKSSNLVLAQVAACPAAAAEEWDRKLVSVEQHAAEVFLLSARQQSPQRYGACLWEIDELLNRRWRVVGALDAGIRRYDKVLKSVRRTLDVPLSFADRRHREKIGLALIAALPAFRNH